MIDFDGQGPTLDSILDDSWKSRGFRARSWGLSVLQGRPASILGAILEAKWEAKEAQMPLKIDLKIYEISIAFFDRILIAKWKPK